VKGCGGGAGKSAHRILRLWKGRGGAGEAGEVAAWPSMGGGWMEVGGDADGWALSVSR
jgi:hypothetical protein